MPAKKHSKHISINMPISNDTIREYKEIMKNDYGLNINYNDAKNELYILANYFETLININIQNYDHEK